MKALQVEYGQMLALQKADQVGGREEIGLVAQLHRRSAAAGGAGAGGSRAVEQGSQRREATNDFRVGDWQAHVNRSKTGRECTCGNGFRIYAHVVLPKRIRPERNAPQAQNLSHKTEIIPCEI